MDYDAKYDIRIASYDDIEKIMQFIDAFWRKDHVLARDRDMFIYEHGDENRVNFILAVNKENGSIEGILGFIPASRSATMLDVWTGIWKVKESAVPLLGVELYKRLPDMIGARALLGVGDNQATTGPILRKLLSGYSTWRMKHYYFLGRLEKFKIAEIHHTPVNNQEDPCCSILVDELIDTDSVRRFIDIEKITSIPHKDFWYLEHRYFKHPIFNYKVYGLNKDNFRAVICLKQEEYDSSRVIRIVDYIGDQECFSELGSFFRRYLDDAGAEYIDFYEHGFSDEYLLKTGFVERLEDDENIIPNYFHPFEKRNIEIWVSGNIADGLFMKADGDQDRPN